MSAVGDDHVVARYDRDEPPGLNDAQVVDTPPRHLEQRFEGRSIDRHHHERGGHDLGDGQVGRCAGGHHAVAQIAVRDDAERLAPFADDHDGARRTGTHQRGSLRHTHPAGAGQRRPRGEVEDTTAEKRRADARHDGRVGRAVGSGSHRAARRFHHLRIADTPSASTPATLTSRIRASEARRMNITGPSIAGQAGLGRHVLVEEE